MTAVDGRRASASRCRPLRRRRSTGAADPAAVGHRRALETEAGTIGALAVYHADRNVYTADHRRLLARVADHAAQVIANAVVFEQTQEQSLTDVLTGLPNRRYLDRQLSQELARVHRHGGQVSVLVLDMDGFKQINDEFGHQAGDRALQGSRPDAAGEPARLRPLRALRRRRVRGGARRVRHGPGRDAAAQELQRAVATLWVEPVPGRRVPLVGQRRRRHVPG